MNEQKKGQSWEDVIQGAGELPEGQQKKPFAERAAEAELWVKEPQDAPADRPVVRMGRPGKVETELVTFRKGKVEKEALKALAEAQGRSLSDLLRGVTHDLVNTFKAGQKAGRSRVQG